MGLQDREYYQDDQPPGVTFRAPQTMVMTLILINVALYLVSIVFTQQVQTLEGTETIYPIVNFGEAQVQTLWNPLQWYRFLTYGFLHSPSDIWHIIGNMIVLFFFGRDIEGVYGKRTFLAFYLSTLVICSVTWALFEQFIMHALPQSSCIGASGAVSAVLMLFILHFPKRMILLFFVLPVPAWVLGIFWVLSELFGGTPGDQIAHSAHLVGFFCGFLFYQTGWTIDRAVPRGINLPGFKLPSLRRKPKLRVHDPDSREHKLESEADRVLAKLHNEGADSLTPREQKILEDYSRRMQQKHR